MSTILRISSRKSRAIRASTRILFLIMGFSLIVMEMAFPPIKPLWMVMGFFLAAMLILFSIMGLSPRLRVSSYGEVINNTAVHIATSFIMGMGIIVAAMINPPIQTIWLAFFNFVGIALVLDSIITSSWNYAKAKKKAKKVQAENIGVAHPSN